jgi:hypothetical protein
MYDLKLLWWLHAVKSSRVIRFADMEFVFSVSIIRVLCDGWHGHTLYLYPQHMLSAVPTDCWGNCPNSPYQKSKSILCGYKYNVQSRHINPCSWRQRYHLKCCILCSHRNAQDCLLENISFWFATCSKFCCHVYEMKLIVAVQYNAWTVFAGLATGWSPVRGSQKMVLALLK